MLFPSSPGHTRDIANQVTKQGTRRIQDFINMCGTPKTRELQQKQEALGKLGSFRLKGQPDPIEQLSGSFGLSPGKPVLRKETVFSPLVTQPNNPGFTVTPPQGPIPSQQIPNPMDPRLLQQSGSWSVTGSGSGSFSLPQSPYHSPNPESDVNPNWVTRTKGFHGRHNEFVFDRTESRMPSPNTLDAVQEQGSMLRKAMLAQK